MSGFERSRVKPVAAAAAAAMGVGALGMLMTDLGSWYQGLRQPDWKPPDWAFGPVWTLIYALAALAGIKAWRLAGASQRRTLLVLFTMNGALNVAWSALFFRLQRPDWALVEVGALWLSILALIIYILPLSRSAGLLLLPYLAWVSLAALLNLDVVRLNQPFGGG